MTDTAVTTTTLTKAEARKLTARIRRATDDLWVLVTEAHDRKVWEPMGYANFAEWLREEVGLGRSRGYQLLAQGKVIKALRDSTIVESVGEPNEAQARELAPLADDPEAATAALAEASSNGKATAKAVRAAVAKRAPKLPKCPECNKPADPSKKGGVIVQVPDGRDEVYHQACYGAVVTREDVAIAAREEELLSERERFEATAQPDAEPPSPEPSRSRKPRKDSIPEGVSPEDYARAVELCRRDGINHERLTAGEVVEILAMEDGSAVEALNPEPAPDVDVAEAVSVAWLAGGGAEISFQYSRPELCATVVLTHKLAAELAAVLSWCVP